MNDSKKLILKPKSLKGDDGYRTFSVRLQEKLISELEDTAQTLGYSRNELISVLLRYGLDNCVIDDGE